MQDIALGHRTTMHFKSISIYASKKSLVQKLHKMVEVSSILEFW